MRAALQGEGGMKVGFSDGARREMKVGVSDGACEGMKVLDEWQGERGDEGWVEYRGVRGDEGWVWVAGWMGLAIRAFAMLTGRDRLAWGAFSDERRDVDNRGRRFGDSP